MALRWCWCVACALVTVLGCETGPTWVAVIEVTPSSLSLPEAASSQLTATPRDVSGHALTGRAVVWQTDAPAVATVSDSGVVTAVALGSARITATVGGKSGTAAITVVRAVVAISAGGRAVCGLARGGAAYCWGDNLDGELGDGSTASHSTPVAVAGAHAFQIISAGGAHTCGLTADGAAYCWGSNDRGQLGRGDSVSALTPVAVAGGLTFVDLTAGGVHTCGLVSTGAAYCWGYNGDGQLGRGDRVNAMTPVAVAGGLSFVGLTAGGSHTCGWASNGAAYCWGAANYGQLGTTASIDSCGTWIPDFYYGPDLPKPCSKVPVPVTGGIPFTALTAGASHSCGVVDDGTTYCWGAATGFGGGVTSREYAPVVVSRGLTFTNLAAGMRHTCGLTKDGIAYCWGDNSYGEIGTTQPNGECFSRPDFSPCAHSPALVAGGLTFAHVTAGSAYACGVTTDGAAFCWGYNGDGQLGDGSTTQRTTPVRVGPF